MNLFEPLLVLSLLIILLIVVTITTISCFKRHKKRVLTKARLMAYTFIILLSLSCVSFGARYVYPFDIKLNPILIAEYDVPKEYELNYPGEKYWCGAYEKYGLYAESFYFNPDEKVSRYGFEWPNMNFDKYSYIITYGQKIDSLSYNVWDTVKSPINTGAKVGHMILENDFHPEKVYVYQIPKLRIENDRNDINRQWD